MDIESLVKKLKLDTRWGNCLKNSQILKRELHQGEIKVVDFFGELGIGKHAFLVIRNEVIDTIAHNNPKFDYLLKNAKLKKYVYNKNKYYQAINSLPLVRVEKLKKVFINGAI